MTAAPRASVDDAAIGTVRQVPAHPPVTVAFTGRHGATGELNLSLVVGGGDVTAARLAALGSVGSTPERAVFMQQVHGGDVAVVGLADAGKGALAYDDAVPAVDALVTRDADLALVVLVADCVPVLLVDPDGAVAAVHAGRGGVERGVVAATIEAMAPADPQRLQGFIGPAIGGCCYEVPGQMAASVVDAWPQAAATTTWGTPSLDLPAAATAQLAAAGVTAVDRVGGCTRCHHDRWFSHRATGQLGAPAGRQAGIVVRSRHSSMDAPPDRAGAPLSLQSP